MYDLAEIELRTAEAAAEAKTSLADNFQADLAKAGEHRRLVEAAQQTLWLRDRVYVAELMAETAEGERSFTAAGLGTYYNYVSNYRAAAVKALPKPLVGPLGLYACHIGMAGRRAFMMAGVEPYLRPTVLSPYFDIASWYRRRDPEVARYLARLLVDRRPDAFMVRIVPHEPQPGDRRRAPAELRDLFELALRRPAKEIDFAAKAAFPRFLPLFERFREVFLALTDRRDFAAVQMAVFSNAADVNVGSARSHFAYMAGDNFSVFKAKRYAEAVLGILPYLPLRFAADLLNAKQHNLAKAVLTHTGVQAGPLVVAGAAGGRELSAWLALGEYDEAGRPGLETADGQVPRLAAGVLEAAVPGCMTEAGAEVGATMPAAVVVPAVVVPRPPPPSPADAKAYAEDLPADRKWQRVHLLAETLDRLSHLPADQYEQWLELLESPILREPMIDLKWYRDRLGFVRGEQDRRGSFTYGAHGWHQSSLAIDQLMESTSSTEQRLAAIRADPALRTVPMRWGFVGRWWDTPIAERAPWGRLVKAATAVDDDAGIYDVTLRDLGRSYRAVEFLNERNFAEAERHTTDLAAVPAGADPWAVIDAMGVRGRVEADVDQHDIAVRRVESALVLSADYGFMDTEAHGILHIAKLLRTLGVPSYDRAEAVIVKAGSAIRPGIALLLRNTAVMDRICLAEAVDSPAIRVELADLATATADAVAAHWIDVAYGLLDYREHNPAAAVANLSSACAGLASLDRHHDSAWARAFRGIAAGRAGDAATAAADCQAVAHYFTTHSHGPVKDCALQLLSAGQRDLAALLDLGKLLIAPQASRPPAVLR
jgi:hypothetical protein